MNWHHTIMAWVLAVTTALVVILGALYGYADHVGTWDGLYLSVETVTTVGYGDLAPHGWAAHAVALAVMILAIPLWSSSFSLLTAGWIADHIDKRHREAGHDTQN